MKRLLTILATLPLLAASASAWMHTPPGEIVGADVRLVASPGLPDGLADAVRDYVERNARLGVALLSAPIDPAAPLDQAGRDALARCGAPHAALATLLLVPSDDPHRGSCWPAESFAVLNVSRMGGLHLDRAILEKRTSQEALRALAVLLGIEPCPFPLCVLTAFSDPAELDEMSDNYCPPCFDRIRHAAIQKGGHALPIADK